MICGQQCNNIALPPYSCISLVMAAQLSTHKSMGQHNLGQPLHAPYSLLPKSFLEFVTASSRQSYFTQSWIYRVKDAQVFGLGNSDKLLQKWHI